MGKIRASFWIGGLCLTYWAVLAMFIFSDLYLVNDADGFFLKLLAPGVLVANLIGIGLGLASWSTHRRAANAAILCNGLPVIGVAWFVWWLFFGVKI